MIILLFNIDNIIIIIIIIIIIVIIIVYKAILDNVFFPPLVVLKINAFRKLSEK